MTQILDKPTTTGGTPQERVDAWLDGFEQALRDRDVERASEMFATTCFWRDLIAFSWNITTVEDRDGVRDLLESTLAATDPSGFATSEPPDCRTSWTPCWFVRVNVVA